MSSLTNFVLADLVSKLKISSSKRLVSVRVFHTKFTLSILRVLLDNGAINGLSIHKGYVVVFLKYYKHKSIFREISIVSRPGKRVFWTLNALSLKYKPSNFSGFYIISTSKGLLTSNDCLLGLGVSGEILLKIVF